MAALSASNLAPVLAFALLLTLAFAQSHSSSYNVTEEQGWSDFVKAASSGSGAPPVDLSEFVAKVNSDVNNSTSKDIDPKLLEDKSNNGGSKTAGEPDQMKTTKLDADPSNISTDAMIAMANGGPSMAPGGAPRSGAFSVKVAGAAGGLLPAIAVYFVL